MDRLSAEVLYRYPLRVTGTEPTPRFPHREWARRSADVRRFFGVLAALPWWWG